MTETYEGRYKYGGFEIFIQRLDQFLANLIMDTGDCQIIEITLKQEYFDRARAYLMAKYHTLTDEPSNGIIQITYNTQFGTILLKRST